MLRGKNVNLRTVRSRDLEKLIDLMSEMYVRGEFFPRMMPTETSIQSRFNKDGYWGDDSGSLLMVDPETDRILGLVAFFKPGPYYDAVEAGYIMYDVESRGKGITPEALMMFVRYLFMLKPIHRIQLQIEAANTSSLRVAEKCGFQFEGTARQAFIVNGVPRDIGVYSLLRSEIEAVPPAPGTLDA